MGTSLVTPSAGTMTTGSMSLGAGFTYLNGGVVSNDIDAASIRTEHWPRLEHYGFPLHESRGQHNRVRAFGTFGVDGAPDPINRKSGRWDIFPHMLDSDDRCILPPMTASMWLPAGIQVMWEGTFSAAVADEVSAALTYLGKFTPYIRLRAYGAAPAAAQQYAGSIGRLGANDPDLFLHTQYTFMASFVTQDAGFYEFYVQYDADGTGFASTTNARHIIIGFSTMYIDCLQP